MHDIAEFLRAHEPFMQLDEAALDALAASTEVEFFAAGDVILGQGQAPDGYARVVRRGAVDVVQGERVLDRLGEGELFGHGSMLSGQAGAAELRAAEDTLCYRLPADEVDALRSAAAPLVEPAGPEWQRVDQLVRERPVICAPDEQIRDAARRMVEHGATSVLVRDASGRLGIVTDHDLRARVVAGAAPLDGPVRLVMSAPAFTVEPDRIGADVMLAMLERGINHVPVVTPRGEVIGVVRGIDLLAAHTHTPFVLRRSIARAPDAAGVAEAAGGLDRAVVALHDSRVPPGRISAVISIVADAATRRLVELAVERHGPPAAGFTWLALGSHGRREAMPASDLDSAVSWEQGGDDPDPRTRAVVDDVLTGLARCGFTSDEHGATAGSSLFARSAEGWRTQIQSLLDDPDRDRALILVSLLDDARLVVGDDSVDRLFGDLGDARRRSLLLRLMLRLALAHRPPTGFLRDIVVEHSGEHRGHFDIKHGGLLPIVNVARYASLAAGTRPTSTPERLAVAADAGTLPDDIGGSLAEAFDVLCRLRLDHQVEQLRSGRPADEYVDPKGLSPLTRRHLRDAFRAVAGAQRALTNELRFN